MKDEKGEEKGEVRSKKDEGKEGEGAIAPSFLLHPSSFILHVHGHDQAVRSLQAALRDDRLHHAYLFAGPPHVGKHALALQLAQALNCDAPDRPCGECAACRRIERGLHADVRVVGVAGGEEGGDAPRTVIGIEAVRDLIDSAYLRPYEGRNRVFIVAGAERMSTEAANALLKVLEEPPPNVFLLLLTEDADAVIATIRSRCMQIDLRPLPVAQVAALLREHYGADDEAAESIARLSRGCVGWAIGAAREPGPVANVHQRLERIADACQGDLEVRFAYADDLARRFQRDRAAAREELFLWLRWLRDILLIQHGRAGSITHTSWRNTLEGVAASLTPAQVVRWTHHVTETLDALERNANARLALEVFMIEAPAMASA